MSVRRKYRSVLEPILIPLFTVIKQAFKIKKGPIPWEKALSAALCAGFPVIIGYLIGQIQLGLLSGIGSFSYLYVFNEPYAQRAKKLFFVAIGISLSVGLGTLAAPSPSLVVLFIGFIGFITTFIFGVLKIPGPAAIFFVLSFIMTTGMPIDPSAAPFRAVIVLMSGIFAWFVSIVGWFINPHGPEIKVLKEVYLSLAAFCEAIGGEDVNQVRHRTVNALKDSDETLLSSYIPWKSSSIYDRLSLLNELANRLFIELLELSYNRQIKIPQKFSELIRELSCDIELKDTEKVKLSFTSQEFNQKYDKLFQIIYDMNKTIHTPSSNIEYEVNLLKPSLKMRFAKASDKDSIVFIRAVRYGVVLSLSTLVAFNFTFTRPYWIPLSCAAVMLGSTIMSTFYRALQRSIGTIIGLFVAIIILNLQPKGLMLAFTIMCLTTLTELFIPQNYALASAFITPNALLLAENSTHIHDVSYFATARITDIVIGSLIGLVGVYLIEHRSASSRLQDLIIKLIYSQSHVIVWLTSNSKQNINDSTQQLKEKMIINLTNFKMAYTTALGEININEEMLEMMWPVTYSLEHISYLLDRTCATKGYLNLSDKDLAQLLFVYEKMGTAIAQEKLVQPMMLPIMNDTPKICQELNLLQEVLSQNVIKL